MTTSSPFGNSSIAKTLSPSEIKSKEAKPLDPIEELVNRVKREGHSVDSRYGGTTEIIGTRLEVSSGLLVQRNGINWSIGWMEMLQLLGGVYDLESIHRVAPQANLSLFTAEMAYGPRLGDQISTIIETLANDRNSRQAVVFIGKPEDGPTSRLPCTLSIQFLLRHSLLDAIVSMRSWDLCRGLPYDLMMFSGLLSAIARCLWVEPGNLIVNAGSAHIYDEWIDKTPKASNLRWRFKDHMARNWEDIQTWARLVYPRLEKGKTPFGISIVDVGGAVWL